MQTLIPFTQFLRPDGRQAPVFIDLGAETHAKAERIIANGFVFQCEEMTTGMCSFTIFDPVKKKDVAIQLCPNGPLVPDAVRTMIDGFYTARRYV